jgi:hypothetical protein
MKTKLSYLLSALIVSAGMSAQSLTCFSTPDGTDANSWSYKDYVIPTGYKIDSVMFTATRPGYPSSQDAFSMMYCPSSTSYSNCMGGKVTLNYANFSTSMYNVWLRVDTAHLTAPGMVRVILPTSAGAVWGQVCFAISSTHCSPDINTGLVVNLPFTGNTNDVSGNGNNGTNNGATLVADRFGNANSAYSFNGINNYIEIPNSPSLNFGTQSFSILAWVKLAGVNSNYNGIVSNMNSSGVGYQFVFLGNSELGQEGISSPVQTGNKNLNDGLWHSITWVVDNTNHLMTYYVDNVLDTSAAITSINNMSNTSTTKIGIDRTLADLYNGIYDDIRIYNRALTACDVDSLHNMPNSQTTGIAKHEMNGGFSIYPNPASDYITIKINESENKPVTIELFDLIGTHIKTETKVSVSGENAFKINLTDVATGLYFIRIGNATQKVQIIK